VTALIRAELLKLKTIGITRWLFATALGFSVLSVLATVLTAGPHESVHLDDPGLLARAVGSAGAGEVILLVLGILAVSQEFRFGTAIATFLATPKRVRVVAAKLIAVSIVGVGWAAASIIVVLGAAVALIRARGGALVWDADLVEVLAGVVVVMALYGPLGVALAALIRNQIAAIVISLAWLFLAEQLLVALFPAVGRWTPGGATAGALQLGPLATTRGALLSGWAGSLVLIAYTATLAVLAARRLTRHDLPLIT
jgi:ABC-2 type transport system permease protein